MCKSCVEFSPPNVDEVLGGRLELQPVPRRARDLPADTEARHILLGRIQSRSSAVDHRVRFVQPFKGNDLSDWVTGGMGAEAAEERMKTLLRAPHSYQTVGKPRTLWKIGDLRGSGYL